MIKQKLQMAADKLPHQTSDYSAIEEKYKQERPQPCAIRRKQVIWLTVLALLLVGCVAGPTVPEYHLYNGSFELLFPGLGLDVAFEQMDWDPTLNSAKKAAEDLGWTIPEALSGSPRLYGAGKYNLTTEESHYLTAMLFHTYTYYSVDYGFEMETEITREDGSTSDAHWTDADASITFGSMDNAVWRRQFGFDENDVWVGFNNLSAYEDSYSLDYEGVTLYVATRRFDNDFYGLTSYYGQYVSWVDYGHNTVFSLYARDDTPDFAIGCAKELIDRNAE